MSEEDSTMEPKRDDKGSFEERLKKIGETLESVILTLKKIVEKREAPTER